MAFGEGSGIENYTPDTEQFFGKIHCVGCGSVHNPPACGR